MAVIQQGIRVPLQVSDEIIKPSNFMMNHHTNTGAITILALVTILLLLAAAILKFRKSFKNRDQVNRHPDVSDLNIQCLEEKVMMLATQNDRLITEMHHQIKNNLQVLNSLINNQLLSAKDNVVTDALLQIKYRVYAISLVHQKLFYFSQTPLVEITSCVKDLVNYLADGYDFGIVADLDLSILNLEISRAIPFTLIICELLSNAFKVREEKAQQHPVKITISKVDKINYRLIFSDNSTEPFEYTKFYSKKSTGLILGLSKQIRASVEISNDVGFSAVISFAVNPAFNENLS